MKVKEFEISKLLKLKLENNKTTIYINRVKIIQCKYLLLNNLEYSNGNDEINSRKLSIDEKSKNLNHSLELINEYLYDISPEVEFWAHCSNLQAWYEHSYNTHLLHSNLSFPLLKRLVHAGDSVAKKVFTDEIMKRFREGNIIVMAFLIIGGFLDELSLEDSDDLYRELNFKNYKKLQEYLRKSEKKDTFIL
ncbi:MAG: hypothetical protein ACTSQU_00420 [Promethearchaeota archaeon]